MLDNHFRNDCIHNEENNLYNMMLMNAVEMHTVHYTNLTFEPLRLNFTEVLDLDKDDLIEQIVQL